MSKKVLSLLASFGALGLAAFAFAAPAQVQTAKPAAPVLAQAPAPAADIKILNLQGTVEIQTPDGKGVVVKAGDPLPKVPPGSRVRVLSGNVVLQAGKAAVTANSGAWFNLNVTAGKDNKVEVTVKVEKGSVPVKTEVSGNVVTVSEGATVNVAIGSKGEISVAATGASVTVQKKDGTTVTVAAGKSMEVAAAPAPAPAHTPAPAEEPTAEDGFVGQYQYLPTPSSNMTREQAEGEESGAGTPVSPSSP